MQSWYTGPDLALTIHPWLTGKVMCCKDGKQGYKIIIFFKKRYRGLEISMFLQSCAFITVSLSQFKCHFEQKFLFLEKTLTLYSKLTNSKRHNSSSVTPSLFRVLCLVLKGWNGPSLPFSVGALTSLCYYSVVNCKQCRVQKCRVNTKPFREGFL